jgi:hypothetical protein
MLPQKRNTHTTYLHLLFVYPAVIVMLLWGIFAACSPVFPHTPAPPSEAPVEEAALLPTDPPSPTDTPEPLSTDKPVPELPTETPTPEPEAEPAVAGLMPQVSHSLAGRERCLMCHAVGGMIQPAPESHTGWSETVCLFCHIPLDAEEIELVPKMPRTATAGFCLDCHGPYEEVMAATVDYIAPRDIEVNPHTFVPHDSDRILECRHCHVVHELPLTIPEELTPANVNHCYLACHHIGTFQTCSECH